MEKHIGDLDKRMAVVNSGNNHVVWYSPDDAPMVLSGVRFRKPGGEFRRLPENPSIPDAVNFLASHTAGMQLRFVSNTSKIRLRVQLFRPSRMDHMAAIGAFGFDFYCDNPGPLTFRGAGRISSLKDDDYECDLVRKPLSPVMRNIVINFPLYSGIKKLEIALDAGADVAPPLPWADPKPIVVYGTSITQGGCASRPGMAYTNILSRRMNREFLNYGFSGNGKGEPEMAQQLSEIPDPALYLLDYEANARAGMITTLGKFIDILRCRHKNVPIVVLSGLRFNEVWEGFTEPADVVKKKLEIKEFQANEVSLRRQAGDKNIYFLDGETLRGQWWSEASVDGCHQTDLGFLLMANTIEPFLKSLL